MIFVLLEQEYNVINPVEDEFLKRYHKTSVKRFGQERVARSEMSIFSKPPLFNSEWLVICTSRMQWLKECFPDRNTVLIKVCRKSCLKEVLDAVSQYEYRLIDNYKLPEEQVVGWIMKTLGVQRVLAARLYNRTAGSLKAIAGAVEKLKLVNPITGKKIDDCVEKAYGASVYSITQYLLGISKKVSYDEIVQMLYDFRYASSWLKKSILEELQQYLDVFLCMDSGELSIVNFRQFMAETKIHHVRDSAPYRIQKMIESHDVVSTEVVFCLILYIRNLPVGLRFVTELLNLLKVGGNNVYRL